MSQKRKTIKPKHLRGTGSNRPAFSLSDNMKKEISALFVRGKFNNKDKAFKLLEQGIEDCVSRSIAEEEYPKEQFKVELETAGKLASNLHALLKDMSLRTFDYINAHAYENGLDDFPREQCLYSLSSLAQFSNASNEILNSKNRAQYRHIHHVTNSVAELITHHTSYKINKSLSGKMIQIVEMLLPEVSKVLKQALVTDEIPIYEARNLVSDFIVHKHLP